MAGKSCISYEFPGAVYLLDGEKHLYWVSEIVFRLIEKAMSKACSNEDTEETIEEERVEQFLFYVTVLVNLLYYKVCGNESNHPAKGVVAHLKAQN